MDYGPDWPPVIRVRRRWRGFGLRVNIGILLGTSLLLALIIIATDRPMRLDLQTEDTQQVTTVLDQSPRTAPAHHH